MQSIAIDDQVFKRLNSIREEIMHSKMRDVTFDEVLNDLIDIYLDNSWGNIGAGAGGG